MGRDKGDFYPLFAELLWETESEGELKDTGNVLVFLSRRNPVCALKRFNRSSIKRITTTLDNLDIRNCPRIAYPEA